MYDEKREFIRMKVDTPVTITVVDTKQSLNGFCKDLSGTGMLLSADGELPLGEAVDVSITSGKNPFVATAEVARVEPENDRYIIGLKINNID